MIEPISKGKPRNAKKATDAELLRSYEQTKSVRKTAREFGMCGQSVWERLQRLGYEFDNERLWTEDEIKILAAAYVVAGDNGGVNLEKLAKKLSRQKSNICRKARELGLTRYGREKPPEVLAESSRRMKKWHEEHEHPRGAYKTGKEIRICPHCGRFFEAFPGESQVYCGMECGHSHRQSQGHQGYALSGKRSDLNGQYFRSRWEANYARYLNFIIAHDKNNDIVRWEFEPDTFEFTKIRRGVRFFTPDFKIYFSDGHVEYHEVKGYDYPKGKTARKRFARYFPNLKLVLVGEEWFSAVSKKRLDNLIPNWEKSVRTKKSCVKEDSL